MKPLFLGEPFEYNSKAIIEDGQLNNIGQALIQKKVYDLTMADNETKKLINNLDDVINKLPSGIERVSSGLRINHKLAMA
jgi:hypothetical protein